MTAASAVLAKADASQLLLKSGRPKKWVREIIAKEQTNELLTSLLSNPTIPPATLLLVAAAFGSTAWQILGIPTPKDALDAVTAPFGKALNFVADHDPTGIAESIDVMFGADPTNLLDPRNDVPIIRFLTIVRAKRAETKRFLGR